MVNLNGIIESALVQKTLILNRVQRKYGAGDIEIFTDEAALARALTNIVINAAEAIDSNNNVGEFCVKTQIAGDGQHIEIILSDTAGGIPSDVLAHLFKEPVYTKSWKKGGQDLMIVKKYIEERCHGTIAVQSAPGKGLPAEAEGGSASAKAGTTFTIRLPLAPPDAQPPSEPLPAPPAPSVASQDVRSMGPAPSTAEGHPAVPSPSPPSVTPKDTPVTSQDKIKTGNRLAEYIITATGKKSLK